MKKKFFATLLLALGMTLHAGAQGEAADMAYDYEKMSDMLYDQYLKKDSTIDLDNRMDKYFTAIRRMFGDNVVNRSRYVADFMHGTFFNWPSPRDCRQEMDLALKECQVDSVRRRLQADYDKFYAAYNAIFEGKQAPDFTFKDVRGKQHRLSDFRGRMVFLDVWGTWCAPCKQEMPYIAKLYEKYKDDKRVAIISVACDKKFDVWKNYLQKHPEPWAQYVVTPEGDKVLDDVYHVYGIPRFMLIGRDGRIIDADSARPSFGDSFDKQFSEALAR